MELKGKTKVGELVILLSKPDSYSIKVVNEESDNGKKKNEKSKKEKESIGNYENDFPKGSVEMQEVKKLSDKETSVKLKFAGERLTFSFVTETPYEKVVEILNEQQKKGIYIIVKQMIVRFSIFSVVVILVALLTKSEAVTLYVIGLTSGLMIGYAYGSRNN